MTKRILTLLPALLLAALLAPGARAGNFTFDTLPGNQRPVPNGYQGLIWDNFRVLNADTFLLASGYKNGVVSHPNLAFNAFGDPASFASTVPFTFNAVYLVAAWNDGLNIQIEGLRSGAVVHSSLVVVDTTGPSFFTFDWAGVDMVRFTSFGGTPHPGYSGFGTSFGMDNLCINVPEGSSLLLLLAGALPLARRSFRGDRRGRS